MDETSSRHPSGKTLSDYNFGKLDDPSSKSVERHLARCPDCLKRVEAMSSDSFLDRIRDAHRQTGTSGPGKAKSGTSGTAGGRVAPVASSLPSELIDHPDYEILRELGHGGMGVVYLANNRLLNRKEVLKVIAQRVVERPEVLHRFLHEIRTVARLRHENIVAAYSALRLGQTIAFAMEYVDGLDLERLVKTSKRSLPIAHSCNFVHQAALALQHAYEEGLVHRDIKPSNLMLSRKGDKATVKVLDFGLAKATREENVDGSVTREGQALGTPDFIAPEQIIDARSADIRADIYSLGGTLYYLLTGRPPFQGNSLYDIYQAHISRDADPLNLVRPEVPEELAALVAKMMAKDPGRRFETPAKVAEALTPFWKKGAGRTPPSLGGTASLQGGQSPSASAKATQAPASTVLSKPNARAPRSTDQPETSSLAPPSKTPAVAKTTRHGGKITWMYIAAAAAITVVALGVALGPHAMTRKDRDTVGAGVSQAPLDFRGDPVPSNSRAAAGPHETNAVNTSVPPRAAETAPIKPVPPLESLPAITDIEPQWPGPDEQATRAATASRETKIRNLAEHPWAELYGLIYRAITQPYELTMAYPPKGSPGAQELPVFPERFLLLGQLMTIRADQGKTWVFLAPAGATIENGPVIDNGNGSIPQPYAAIELGDEKTVDSLADYRAGDHLSVLVKRQAWRQGDAPRNALGSPPWSSSDARLAKWLDPLILEHRAFRKPGGAGFTVYWCFVGEGIQKVAQPLTWVEPGAGFHRKPENGTELRHSLTVLARKKGAGKGITGRLTAQFHSVRALQRNLWALLTIPASGEGPIPVVANLGPVATPAEFLDYGADDIVEAEVTLDVPTGPTPNPIFPKQTPMAFQPPMLGFGSGPWQSRIATEEDPLSYRPMLYATCARIQSQGRAESLVSATGPRRVARLDTITPDVASASPTATLGKEVRWSGKLASIGRREGRTHVVVSLSDSIIGLSSFEAFATKDGVFEDLADYSASEDTFNADDVEVTGTICPRDAAATRLAAEVPLLRLIQIERKDIPSSRVAPGNHRDAASFRPREVGFDVIMLLRDHPTPGKSVRFEACFDHYNSYDHYLTVKAKDGYRNLTIHFPNSGEKTFSDYQRDDVVQVTATSQEPRRSSTGNLEWDLLGKSIVREKDPRSLVTDKGRRAEALDFKAGEKTWAESRSKPLQNRGKKIQGCGVFEKYEFGPSVFIVKLGRPFRSYGHLEIYMPATGRAQQTLEQLRPQEEVAFEVTVEPLGKNSGEVRYRANWIARLSDPGKKLPLQ